MISKFKGFNFTINFVVGVWEEFSGTNSTDLHENTSIIELNDKVTNICYGGAIAYSSKELIKHLIVDATPNLLI